MAFGLAMPILNYKGSINVTLILPMLYVRLWLLITYARLFELVKPLVFLKISCTFAPLKAITNFL
jgi:hypothetical protein